MSTSTGAKVFPALDSMRAVAALAVLGTHAAFWGGSYTDPIWGTALARLDVGVAVFFVLSGFLLSRPWFDRHVRGDEPPSTGRYLWKRALRLVPVYVLTVVAALTLLPGNRNASVGEWFTTLLMGNTYVSDRLPDGLTQMWSLSTEVAFYLVLPGVMWLASSRRRGGPLSWNRLGMLVLGLTALNVAWTMELAGRFDSDVGMHRLWLPSYLTWFCVGLVLAACEVHIHHAVPDRFAAVVRELGCSPGLCWTAAAALFVVASTPVAGPADLTPPTLGAAMSKNLLYAAVAGLVVLPGVFAPTDGRFARTLANPIPRHVGHLSYGVFCVHLVLLELIADWRNVSLFEGRTWELFGLTLLASLLVAELLYRGVERPSQRLRNLRSPRSTSAAASAPSANATST